MSWEIRQGDALERLREMPDCFVQMCATSPPYYGLRDYGTAAWEGGDEGCEHVVQHARTVSGGEGKQYTNAGSNRVFSGDCACGARRVDHQIGLEQTPEEYVGRLVEVFREVRRVLRDDGTCWVNLGDSFSSGGRGTSEHHSKKIGANTASAQALGRKIPTQGLKPKDLIGIPWMVVFALRADGWYLRSDIIWAKSNPMPESVTDRPTKSHEYIFLLTKAERYFYDAEAIKEPALHEGEKVGGSLSVYGPDEKLISQNAHRGKPYLFIAATRNKRSVWAVNTQSCKEAHFATWPPKLVEIMVKAGTSEKGCCPACGAPWRRVVERTEQEDTSAKGSRFDAGKTGTRDGGERTQAGPRFTSAATGWTAGCECSDEIIPLEPVSCTVLDPFSGAATTGLVALSLGRNYLGIELNPEYIEIGKRRLAKVDAWQPGLFSFLEAVE